MIEADRRVEFARRRDSSLTCLDNSCEVSQARGPHELDASLISAHSRCAQAGDSEALAFGRCGQAFVETHTRECRGAPLGRCDARRKLKGVSGAQLVDPQEAQSLFPQRLGWLYLMPRCGKAIEPATCRRRRTRPKPALTFETRDR